MQCAKVQHAFMLWPAVCTATVLIDSFNCNLANVYSHILQSKIVRGIINSSAREDTCIHSG